MSFLGGQQHQAARLCLLVVTEDSFRNFGFKISVTYKLALQGKPMIG